MQELTREKKVDMGENLLAHEGTETTSTVFLPGFFFLSAMRTGLYFSKAVGVIRKNTEFL